MHRTSIDGVTCFWVDSGRPTLMARLLFRVGSADEPLNEAGWLHLLEHSALHGRGGGALGVNGFVAPLLTGFDAHGPAAEVSRHLREVTGVLAAPGLADLVRERDVLMAEADLRGGPAVRAFGWRYGARGPGVIAMGEHGLGRATPELLAARAHRLFTQENAVLVLDGPPPTDLLLTLPRGELQPIPRAVPCDETYPGWYVDDAGLVLSGVVPRSPGATILPSILERELKSALRDTAGASYAPWGTYEAVDFSHALVLAGADASRSVHPTMAETGLRIVHRLAEDGPNPEHLADVVDAWTQSHNDPYNVVGVAMRAAHDHLRGLPIKSHDEVLAEMHGTGVEQVRTDAAAFAQTLLMGIPGEAAAPQDLPRIVQPIKRGWVAGRRFRHQDWPASPSSIVVDLDDAHLVADDEHRCYHAADVEGMLVFADGGRHLITADGWGLSVDPGEWRNADGLVAALDAMVPVDRHLAMPARGPRDPHRRLGLLKRWWWAARKRTWNHTAAAAASTFFLAVGVTLLVNGRVGSGAVALFWAVYCGRHAWRRWRQRSYRGLGDSKHRGGADGAEPEREGSPVREPDAMARR